MTAAACLIGAAAVGSLLATTSGRAATAGRSTLEVTERDFSISAPKHVRAGDVQLTVTNNGPDTHELIVVRSNGAPLPLRSDGLTVDEQRVEPRTVVSLDGAGPHRTRSLHVHLAPRALHPALQHGRSLPRWHAHAADRAVTMFGAPAFNPFAARGRRAVVAIVMTFGLCTAVSVGLSIWATSRSQHKATVVEVAARQRTLAERYLVDVLLERQGRRADSVHTAWLLRTSARVLENNGVAPAVPGDDDGTRLAAASGTTVRAQLMQERRLVDDLTRTGTAFLSGAPVDSVPLTAHEHLQTSDPIQRLRILTAMTSNVSLDAARTIASATDRNISNLVILQIALGVAGCSSR